MIVGGGGEEVISFLKVVIDLNSLYLHALERYCTFNFKLY